MSLVFTANHGAGVVQVAVLESPGPMVRPSNWALPRPGEFSYAHRALQVTWKTFEIGPLLGMAQSLLTAPSGSLLNSHIASCLAHVRGTAVPFTRANTGGCWDAGLLAQASCARADDGLRAIGDLQLGQDVGDVVAYRLGGQGKPGSNSRVVVASRQHG
jgi:hypothetical protein